MAEDHPFTITVEPDLLRDGRFRWTLRENEQPRNRSTVSYATKREALADAAKALDKQIADWRPGQMAVRHLAVPPSNLTRLGAALADVSGVTRRRKMTRWSIEDAVAMERRHVLAGEKMVSRQECLANELVGKGRDQLAQSANEVLVILRESLDLSRKHLSRLEGLLRDAPKSM